MAISAATQRSRTVKDQLDPQDGLYGILEAKPGRSRMEIIGSVREVLFPDEDHARLLENFAAPRVTVVTMTVTEKGYARDASGALDLDAPAVVHDLSGAQPVTAIGRLVAGLRERAHRVGEGLSVMSCDNLPQNGRVVKALVESFCTASGQSELSQWIDDHIAFPSSMVDRIVPASTESDRRRASVLVGHRDEALVVAEPFRQWVIEDHFVGDRPGWELVGAQLAVDVEPFELMKLRLLNGTHSALAYLGALKGHRYIADAVRDPELHAYASALMEEELIPTLEAPDGVDLASYAELILRRFANVALAHKTTQIAMDGSLKLPVRLVPALQQRLDAGRSSTHLTRAIGGWMTYIALPRGDGALDLVLKIRCRICSASFEGFGTHLRSSMVFSDCKGSFLRTWQVASSFAPNWSTSSHTS